MRSHHDFPSRFLKRRRTLIVSLPPGYSTHRLQRYPVLYLHDGQNLFHAAASFADVTWEADRTAARLIRSERIRPVILVGICNTEDRLDEYAPWRDRDEKAGGRGKRYAGFLVEEVKPFIDSTYRTRRDREGTGVAGSSLGGLISLYIASQYPEHFGLCGALSPSLWWAKERMLRELNQSSAWVRTVRFWIDMGTREGLEPGGAIATTRRLIERFDRRGLNPGRDYYYWEVADGEHHETSWAARFDKVLLYLYGQ